MRAAESAVEARDRADDLARSRGAELAGRAGLTGKAVLYLLIGLLAFRVAAGDYSEEADSRGALRAVARQPFGRVLLVAVAVGLAGYALWRYSQVLTAEKAAKKVAAFGRGLLYTGLAVSAVRLVVSADEAEAGGGNEAETGLTARVMGWPAGRWLVAAVGLGLIAYGVWNVVRAATGGYRKDMELYDMSPRARRWFDRVAVVGLAARGTVFGLAGAFLVRAAWQFEPGQAAGLDDALKRLATARYGPLLLGLVAVGLVAYAVFVAVQARYRRVTSS